MRRQSTASITSSPVLVGAVTLLVAIVAVFLSYNANSGLPFVPTTRLIFESPNGAALTKGNQVREGGRRVGIVTELKPVRKESGRTVAQIVIKLDGSYGDVPANSSVAIRPLSLSGLKYVELTRGDSRRALFDGDTIPVQQRARARAARRPREHVRLGDAQGRAGRDHRGRHRADRSAART